MRKRGLDRQHLAAGISRRRWLTEAVAAGLFGSYAARGGHADDADDPEAKEVAAINEMGRTLEIKPFRTVRSAHFLGIGDSTEVFLAVNLRDLEGLTADFLDHFRHKGFDLTMPSQRLTAVILADSRSFAAFVEERSLRQIPNGPGAPPMRGRYQPRTNRLVLFDNRSLGPQTAPRPAHDNLRVVAHEGIHQLSYNTGLLRRDGDVPRCIAEGLAMYGEVRSFTGRSQPGRFNRMRFTDLNSIHRKRVGWIPVDRLLTEDRMLIEGGTSENYVAYAESWLLVDYLLKDGTRLPAFRAYLKALKDRRDAKARLDDAKIHFGDLSKLDEDLRQYSKRIAPGRRTEP
jgi:hypothetical protein